MPHAICTECGKPLHYRNTRGARLSDMRCPCGGSLAAAQWQGGKIIPRPKATAAAAGRTYERCVVCGHRRLYTRRVETPFRHRFWDPEGVVHPAGSAVCHRCDVKDSYFGPSIIPVREEVRP